MGRSTTTAIRAGIASTPRSRRGAIPRTSVPSTQRGGRGKTNPPTRGSASGPALSWARSWGANADEATSAPSRRRIHEYGRVVARVLVLLLGSRGLTQSSKNLPPDLSCARVASTWAPSGDTQHPCLQARPTAKAEGGDVVNGGWVLPPLLLARRSNCSRQSKACGSAQFRSRTWRRWTRQQGRL